MPTVKAFVSRIWGKEDELKGLKSELATLDRKITAELAPKTEEQDDEGNKQQPDTQQVDVSQTNGSKESMVAEPIYYYRTKYYRPGL